MTHRPLIRAALPVAVLALAPSGALAAGQSMVISATVVQSCEMNVEPMQFGTLGSADASGSAQSDVVVDCSPDTSYAVAMDEGLNAVAGERRMANADGTGHIAYAIYRDAAGTQPWRSGTEALTGIAPTTPVRLTAYARTAPTAATPGEYQDVVTVTIVF